MSEEMTFNDALQEIVRFKNVWRAAVRLELALTQAANFEAEIKDLERRAQALRDEVARTEAWAETRREEIQATVTAAQQGSEARIEDLRKAEEKAAQEANQRQARKERQVAAAIEALEGKLQDRRKAIRERTLEVDQQIAKKQALIAELDEQLGNFRKRLE